MEPRTSQQSSPAAPGRERVRELARERTTWRKPKPSRCVQVRRREKSSARSRCGRCTQLDGVRKTRSKRGPRRVKLYHLRASTSEDRTSQKVLGGFLRAPFVLQETGGLLFWGCQSVCKMKCLLLKLSKDSLRARSTGCVCLRRMVEPLLNPIPIPCKGALPDLGVQISM